MDIQSKERDDNILVLKLEGEIDIYSSSDVKDSIINSIDSGVKNIIIDLENVSYIDSSGIGAFISSLAAIKKIGGKMCFIQVSESVKKVFELTRLTNFFKIYKNEEEAVIAISH